MEKNKGKIALVINSLSNGGAERVVSNLTLGLSDTYECDVIVNDDAVVDYPINGRIISLGLKPSKDRMRLGYQLKAFVVRLRQLRKLKKSGNYDAMISFSDSANVANILTASKSVKTIISVHINISKAKSDIKYKYIVAPFIRLVYNRADAIVAVSEGIKCDLIANYGVNPNKICAIPNGCDNEKVRGWIAESLSDVEKEWVTGENVIASMGRLTFQKGHWHLIRAAYELKKRGCEFKVLILGQGEQEEYLRCLIRELNLEDSVILCGFCKNPFRILAKADFFVSASLFEGYPNNLVEAMSCGLPCVSCDFDSGAREILAPDTDVLYKNTDRIEKAQYGIVVPVCDDNLYSSEDPLSREEILLADAMELMIRDDSIKREYVTASAERAAQLDLANTSREWIRVVEDCIC